MRKTGWRRLGAPSFKRSVSPLFFVLFFEGPLLSSLYSQRAARAVDFACSVLDGVGSLVASLGYHWWLAAGAAESCFFADCGAVVPLLRRIISEPN